MTKTKNTKTKVATEDNEESGPVREFAVESPRSLELLFRVIQVCNKNNKDLDDLMLTRVRDALMGPNWKLAEKLMEETI